MKAVRSIEGGVAVVDLDEPPGSGELVQIASASICASDLGYIQFGSRAILGHELAGHLEDGTPVAVEAIYGCMDCEQCRARCLQPVPDPRPACSGCQRRRRHGRALPRTGSTTGPAPARTGRGRRVARRTGLRLVACAETRRCRTGYHGCRRRGGRSGAPGRPGARRQGAVTVDLEARHPHQREAGERLGARIGTE